MSVINETLENLKQGKKRTGSLNPSSSAYREAIAKSEKASFSLKSYMIPLSFAVVVGVLFYVSKIHSPAISSAEVKVENATQLTQSNRKSSLNNPLAQGLYYEAMKLLNQGQEEQALLSLKQIINKYPDFAPAQNAYRLLGHHS